MTINTLPTAATPNAAAIDSLGDFLRDRRARVTPAAAARGRRRTPGLRREEVAARADVSVTWYTWLEQGRGGPPSADVLERLARALELDAAAREVLFLLAQQRPPPVRPGPTTTAAYTVSPALQRVLDAMPASPALVKTATWDVVAWNRAAAAVLGDYGQLPPSGRNALRRFFTDPAMRTRLPDWEDNARFVLATFRVDAARAARHEAAAELVAELSAASPDFRRLWAENDVRHHGTGVKRFVHPVAGPLNLEYSAYTVDEAQGLGMVVYTPVTDADARAICRLLAPGVDALAVSDGSRTD